MQHVRGSVLRCELRFGAVPRLIALLVGALGEHVPVAVVALEAMGLLLEVLGEVPPETVAALHDPLLAKLTGPCYALRSQARSGRLLLSTLSGRRGEGEGGGAPL
jgi:hypothetical protein